MNSADQVVQIAKDIRERYLFYDSCRQPFSRRTIYRMAARITLLAARQRYPILAEYQDDIRLHYALDIGEGRAIVTRDSLADGIFRWRVVPWPPEFCDQCPMYVAIGIQPDCEAEHGGYPCASPKEAV